MAVRELSIKELGIVAGGMWYKGADGIWHAEGVTVDGSYNPYFDYSNPYDVTNGGVSWVDYGDSFLYYDGDGGGGGGGGGDGLGSEITSSTANEHIKNIANMLLQHFEAYKGGTTGLGSVFNAWTYADLSAQLLLTTAAAAINDIQIYMAIGSHQPHSLGSLVNWANSDINWSDYDTGSTHTPEEIFSNYLDALEGSSGGGGGSGSGGGSGGGDYEN